MNAKQRKKDRKQKALVELGRNAQLQISIARAEAEAKGSELEHKQSALRGLMQKAATLEEAVALAEAQANKHDEEIIRLNSFWEKHLQDAKASFDEALLLQEEKLNTEWQKRHQEVLEANQKLVEENTRLREDNKEPTKLRRRLAEKTKEIEELKSQLNKAEQTIVQMVRDAPIVLRTRKPGEAVAEDPAQQNLAAIINSMRNGG